MIAHYVVVANRGNVVPVVQMAKYQKLWRLGTKSNYLNLSARIDKQRPSVGRYVYLAATAVWSSVHRT
jgi:hypothetical protein